MNNACLVTLLTLLLQPVELVPVDQRIEDVSPLGLSLREVQPTLREPHLQELYRFRGDDENLVRAQGGLYIVFQRSVYGSDKDGNVFPMFPPNTVFYIGPPPGWAVSTAMQAVARREVDDAGRIDDRLDLRVPPGRVVGAPGSEPIVHRVAAVEPPPVESAANRIVLDPEYRAERIRALLLQAARGPSSSSSK